MSKKIKWMVTISIFLIISTIFLFSQLALAKGKWQIGPHYGIWTLSPVESMIEDLVGDTLESEFQGLIEEHLEIIAPDWEYTPDIHFGSGGTNLGLEVRFYPGGEDGSFSIGLAVEKSQLELTLSGSIKFKVADGSYVQGSADTRLLLEPTSYHLSLRWDIKPSWRLHPYIGFGAGIGSLNGVLTYDDVSVEAYDDSTATTVTVTYPSGQMDLADLLEDAGYPTIPLPILQLNLGFNFRITNYLHVLFDAGIWNGFLVRGGVSLRV